MENKYKGLGIASMILGIVSIVMCWTIVVSIVCAIAGMTLGVWYLTKTKQERGFAITGFITSWIGMLLSLFLCLLIIFLGVSGEHRSYRMGQPNMPYDERFFDDYFDNYDDYGNYGDDGDYFDGFFYDNDDINGSSGQF